MMWSGNSRNATSSSTTSTSSVGGGTTGGSGASVWPLSKTKATTSTTTGSTNKKSMPILRTCMCDLGEKACQGLTIAFGALPQDPRGKFVCIPKNDLALYTTYCHYLRPKQQDHIQVIATGIARSANEDEMYYYIAGHHFDPTVLQQQSQPHPSSSRPDLLLIAKDDEDPDACAPNYKFDQAHQDLRIAMRLYLNQIQQEQAAKRELRRSRRREMLEIAARKMIGVTSKRKSSRVSPLLSVSNSNHSSQPHGAGEKKEEKAKKQKKTPQQQKRQQQQQRATTTNTTTTTTTPGSPLKIEMKPTFETAQEGEIECFLDTDDDEQQQQQQEQQQDDVDQGIEHSHEDYHSYASDGDDEYTQPSIDDDDDQPSIDDDDDYTHEDHDYGDPINSSSEHGEQQGGVQSIEVVGAPATAPPSTITPTASNTTTATTRTTSPASAVPFNLSQKAQSAPVLMPGDSIECVLEEIFQRRASAWEKSASGRTYSTRNYTKSSSSANTHPMGSLSLSPIRHTSSTSPPRLTQVPEEHHQHHQQQRPTNTIPPTPPTKMMAGSSASASASSTLPPELVPITSSSTTTTTTSAAIATIAAARGGRGGGGQQQLPQQEQHQSRSATQPIVETVNDDSSSSSSSPSQEESSTGPFPVQQKNPFDYSFEGGGKGDDDVPTEAAAMANLFGDGSVARSAATTVTGASSSGPGPGPAGGGGNEVSTEAAAMANLFGDGTNVVAKQQQQSNPFDDNNNNATSDPQQRGYDLGPNPFGDTESLIMRPKSFESGEGEAAAAGGAAASSGSYDFRSIQKTASTSSDAASAAAAAALGLFDIPTPSEATTTAGFFDEEDIISMFNKQQLQQQQQPTNVNQEEAATSSSLIPNPPSSAAAISAMEQDESKQEERGASPPPSSSMMVDLTTGEMARNIISSKQEEAQFVITGRSETSPTESPPPLKKMMKDVSSQQQDNKPQHVTIKEEGQPPMMSPESPPTTSKKARTVTGTTTTTGRSPFATPPSDEVLKTPASIFDTPQPSEEDPKPKATAGGRSFSGTILFGNKPLPLSPQQPAGLSGFQEEEEEPLADIRNLLRSSNVIVQTSHDHSNSSNFESMEQVDDIDLADVSSTINDDPSLDSKPKMIFVSQAESEKAARGDLYVEPSICYHNNPRTIAIFYVCMMLLGVVNVQYARVLKHRKILEALKLEAAESSPPVSLEPTTAHPWSIDEDNKDPTSDIEPGKELLEPDQVDGVTADDGGSEAPRSSSWLWGKSAPDPADQPAEDSIAGSDDLDDGKSATPDDKEVGIDSPTEAEEVPAPKKSSWFWRSSPSPADDSAEDTQVEARHAADDVDEESKLEVPTLTDEDVEVPAPKLSWFWGRSADQPVDQATAGGDDADEVTPPEEKVGADSPSEGAEVPAPKSSSWFFRSAPSPADETAADQQVEEGAGGNGSDEAINERKSEASTNEDVGTESLTEETQAAPPKSSWFWRRSASPTDGPPVDQPSDATTADNNQGESSLESSTEEAGAESPSETAEVPTQKSSWFWRSSPTSSPGDVTGLPESLPDEDSSSDKPETISSSGVEGGNADASESEVTSPDTPIIEAPKKKSSWFWKSSSTDSIKEDSPVAESDLQDEAEHSSASSTDGDTQPVLGDGTGTEGVPADESPKEAQDEKKSSWFWRKTPNDAPADNAVDGEQTDTSDADEDLGTAKAEAEVGTRSGASIDTETQASSDVSKQTNSGPSDKSEPKSSWFWRKAPIPTEDEEASGTVTDDPSATLEDSDSAIQDPSVAEEDQHVPDSESSTDINTEISDLAEEEQVTEASVADTSENESQPREEAKPSGDKGRKSSWFWGKSAPSDVKTDVNENTATDGPSVEADVASASAGRVGNIEGSDKEDARGDAVSEGEQMDESPEVVDSEEQTEDPETNSAEKTGTKSSWFWRKSSSEQPRETGGVDGEAYSQEHLESTGTGTGTDSANDTQDGSMISGSQDTDGIENAESHEEISNEDGPSTLKDEADIQGEFSENDSTEEQQIEDSSTKSKPKSWFWGKSSKDGADEGIIDSSRSGIDGNEANDMGDASIEHSKTDASETGKTDAEDPTDVSKEAAASPAEEALLDGSDTNVETGGIESAKGNADEGGVPPDGDDSKQKKKSWSLWGKEGSSGDSKHETSGTGDNRVIAEDVLPESAAGKETDGEAAISQSDTSNVAQDSSPSIEASNLEEVIPSTDSDQAASTVKTSALPEDGAAEAVVEEANLDLTASESADEVTESVPQNGTDEATVDHAEKKKSWFWRSGGSSSEDSNLDEDTDPSATSQASGDKLLEESQEGSSESESSTAKAAIEEMEDTAKIETEEMPSEQDDKASIAPDQVNSEKEPPTDGKHSIDAPEDANVADTELSEDKDDGIAGEGTFEKESDDVETAPTSPESVPDAPPGASSVRGGKEELVMDEDEASPPEEKSATKSWWQYFARSGDGEESSEPNSSAENDELDADEKKGYLEVDEETDSLAEEDTSETTPEEELVTAPSESTSQQPTWKRMFQPSPAPGNEASKGDVGLSSEIDRSEEQPNLQGEHVEADQNKEEYHGDTYASSLRGLMENEEVSHESSAGIAGAEGDQPHTEGKGATHEGSRGWTLRGTWNSFASSAKSYIKSSSENEAQPGPESDETNTLDQDTPRTGDETTSGESKGTSSLESDEASSVEGDDDFLDFDVLDARKAKSPSVEAEVDVTEEEDLSKHPVAPKEEEEEEAAAEKEESGWQWTRKLRKVAGLDSEGSETEAPDSKTSSQEGSSEENPGGDKELPNASSMEGESMSEQLRGSKPLEATTPSTETDASVNTGESETMPDTGEVTEDADIMGESTVEKADGDAEPAAAGFLGKWKGMATSFADYAKYTKSASLPEEEKAALETSDMPSAGEKEEEDTSEMPSALEASDIPSAGEKEEEIQPEVVTDQETQQASDHEKAPAGSDTELAGSQAMEEEEERLVVSEEPEHEPENAVVSQDQEEISQKQESERESGDLPTEASNKDIPLQKVEAELPSEEGVANESVSAGELIPEKEGSGQMPEDAASKIKSHLKYAIVRWYNSGFALESVLLIAGAYFYWGRG